MKLFQVLSMFCLFIIVSCTDNKNHNDVNNDARLDELEILDVLNRHQIYIDLRDEKAYAALYAPDGDYKSPFGSSRGTEAITKMFIHLKESGFTRGKRHFNGPAMINISGDSATAFSNWWVSETAKPSLVYATGTYNDLLRKINGTWKIQSRVQTVDIVETSH